MSPTQQSWLAYLRGEVLLDDDADTALAAFTRAIELADAAGSHYVGGVARVSAITLQSRTAPAHAALPLYADVIDRWLEAASWSHLLTTMRNLVPTLIEVGADAAAAQALGAVTRPDQTPTYGQELERLSAAESVRARGWAPPTSSTNALSAAPVTWPRRAAPRSQPSGDCWACKP